MFSPSKEHLAVLECLLTITGGIQELNNCNDPGPWWFAARHRGREVRVGLSDNEGNFAGLVYAAPLGGRPLHCDVEGCYASSLTLPLVQTGDPEFEARVQVHGTPPQVVASALDSHTRRWILDTHTPPRVPQIKTESGYVGIYRSYYEAVPPIPAPQEIVQWLDRALALADRLTGAFDTMVRGIQTQQGAAVAEQWLAQQVSGASQREQSRSNVRLLVVLVLVAIVVLPILGVAGCLFVGFLQTH